MAMNCEPVNMLCPRVTATSKVARAKAAARSWQARSLPQLRQSPERSRIRAHCLSETIVNRKSSIVNRKSIMVTDQVWKLPAVVNRFLAHRAAIPLAQEQIGVMVSILTSRLEPLERFLDLGCGDGILGAAILGEFPSSRGVLADFSESMLDQARQQLEEYAGQLV